MRSIKVLLKYHPDKLALTFPGVTEARKDAVSKLIADMNDATDKFEERILNIRQGLARVINHAEGMDFFEIPEETQKVLLDYAYREAAACGFKGKILSATCTSDTVYSVYGSEAWGNAAEHRSIALPSDVSRSFYRRLFARDDLQDPKELLAEILAELYAGAIRGGNLRRDEREIALLISLPRLPREDLFLGWLADNSTIIEEN